ncbi:MAG: DUF695 domain-containing protein [Cytophagales bacterium]|jgi:hypothetical protein|nr:DUF695 domain-containing protein [Cytophagales bacterium]
MPAQSYTDFWNWFRQHEKAFFEVVKTRSDIEKGFFDQISPKLSEIKDGFFLLIGMADENTAELVLTADSVIKNIVFVEELVAAAPAIDGWKFTALKPGRDITNISIEMSGCRFDTDNVHFYSNDYPEYPDEIDITVVHDDLTAENESVIINGSQIFLDNYLGELDFATMIDNLSVAGRREAEKELVPIEKLKSFLVWRQKEFVEKYEETLYNTENDSYSAFEAELNNGNPWFAVINTSILEWDGKASHPWILNIEIKYDGENNNGLPDNETYELLNEIEDAVLDELTDTDGYLYIGRQTADSVREIYLACKDFRKPSKVMYAIEQKFSEQLEISYSIYKDKYWQSFDRFRQ